MFDTISQIIGDDLVLIILKDLKSRKISTQEAFEKICEILQINLELFSATKNVHNAVLIAKLIAAKIFPSHFLNPELINLINRERKINFTKDKYFGDLISQCGERIKITEEEEFTPALTKGCSILLFEIRDATSDKTIDFVINKLDKYIESTGNVLKSEDILE